MRTKDEARIGERPDSVKSLRSIWRTLVFQGVGGRFQADCLPAR